MMAAAIAGPAFVGVFTADSAATAATTTSFSYGAYSPNLGGTGYGGSITGTCRPTDKVTFSGVAEDKKTGAQGTFTGTALCDGNGRFTMPQEYLSSDGYAYGRGDADQMLGALTESDLAGQEVGTFTRSATVIAQ